jgi:predicted DNA-binding WGR domain protein
MRTLSACRITQQLMIKEYYWINQSNFRYYKLIINESVIICKWGGSNSKRGGQKKICVSSQDEANKYIDRLLKRRSKRGYSLVTNN